MTEMEAARINTAIDIISHVCRSYEQCSHCPLYADDLRETTCVLDAAPNKWHPIKMPERTL